MVTKIDEALFAAARRYGDARVALDASVFPSPQHNIALIAYRESEWALSTAAKNYARQQRRRKPNPGDTP